jgi:hypothetical protein
MTEAVETAGMISETSCALTLTGNEQVLVVKVLSERGMRVRKVRVKN